MTDISQLREAVAEGESETLEFKKTTGERQAAMQSLCAMLNQRGGRVIFGVDPKGTILGQQVSDRTLEEVAHEIQQLDPTVFPQVDRIDVREGLQAIVVTVVRGRTGPTATRGKPTSASAIPARR